MKDWKTVVRRGSLALVVAMPCVALAAPPDHAPAPDAGAVHAFYGTAIAAGGRSDREPGIRPEYNRDYYSARVFDFDGNSLEAVFRGAVAQSAA